MEHSRKEGVSIMMKEQKNTARFILIDLKDVVISRLKRVRAKSQILVHLK